MPESSLRYPDFIGPPLKFKEISAGKIQTQYQKPPKVSVRKFPRRSIPQAEAMQEMQFEDWEEEPPGQGSEPYFVEFTVNDVSALLDENQITNISKPKENLNFENQTKYFLVIPDNKQSLEQYIETVSKNLSYTQKMQKIKSAVPKANFSASELSDLFKDQALQRDLFNGRLSVIRNPDHAASLAAQFKDMLV